MISTSSQPHGKQRLDSWKEIAAFFDRDERTVRRWELDRGLPVHRAPGSARGVVFAFTEELEEWLRRPQAVDPMERASQRPVSQALAPSAEKAFPRSRAYYLPLLASMTLLLLVALVGSSFYSHRRTSQFRARAAGKPDETAALVRHVPTPEAQDLYLKGRLAWSQRTPESLNQAVDLFTQAIVHDPKFAAAYVGLSDCYNLLREFSVMPPSEAYPRAVAAARKAVELDPDSSEAHTSLAFALFWGNIDVAAADREFKHALALDPRNTRAHHWYATYLVQICRYPEALAQIERARQLDPSSAAISADKGKILVMSGQTLEGIALLKQVEAADPSFSEVHRYLSDANLDMGHVRAYFEEAAIANRLSHDNDGELVLEEQRKGFAAQGLPGLRQATLRAHRRLYEEGRATDFTLAVDYSLLNDKADALQHLEIAYERHDPMMAAILGYTDLRNVREEAAFRTLAAKVGLPSSP